MKQSKIIIIIIIIVYSGNIKAPAKSPESLHHHEGAASCASSNEETSSLISVSTQLEAVRNNGQCTIELIQSLVNMVTNVTKEVTELKNDNTLLKREIKNLRSLIEASPRPTSQYITREQRILLPEMSHKDAASIQRVPSAALPTEALPATSILAGTTFSYRDVAAAEISAS
jgi:peptidoglycan hydrolase CwlO-like protein